MNTTALRTDVRRMNARFDGGICHACGTRHLEEGNPIVWHGPGQGASHETCYDDAARRLQEAARFPLFANLTDDQIMERTYANLRRHDADYAELAELRVAHEPHCHGDYCWCNDGEVWVS